MSGARRLSLHRVPALKKRSKYKEENVPALFYNRIEMKTVRGTCYLRYPSQTTLSRT
jgi:hypothetical protein